MVTMLHQAAVQNQMVHSVYLVPAAEAAVATELGLHVVESVVTPTTALFEYDINLKGE
jgi:hypothetical protein